eukprot:TRINITY_DN2923_c0_g1_i1.p1 TRINITY_DN2923_c0_g1~~TRINITY_DN2923_c0_g1_i1.p1  ORF type:complete len:397 (-),score=51.37 TRINITY_DN2923_c0_g1_i1:272-1432(-)
MNDPQAIKKELLEEREELLRKNLSLQKTLSQYFATKQSYESGAMDMAYIDPTLSVQSYRSTNTRSGIDDDNIDTNQELERHAYEQEQQYMEQLFIFQEISEAFNQKVATYDMTLEQLVENLESEEVKRKAGEHALVTLRQKMASMAKFSRTQQPLPHSGLKKLEDQLDAKNHELMQIRIHYQQIDRKLRALDGQLRHHLDGEGQKKRLEESREETNLIDSFDNDIEEMDYLSDGNSESDEEKVPRLMDFEQLKIENQTFNEKIEERNEEILKLRKKIDSTVQILSHVEKKYYHLRKTTQNLDEKLSTLHVQLDSHRNALNTVKAEKTKLNNEVSQYQQDTAVMTNPKLSRDYAIKKEQINKLNETIAELNAELYKLGMSKRSISVN